MKGSIKQKYYILLDAEPTKPIRAGLCITLKNEEKLTTDIAPYQTEYDLPKDLDPLDIVSIDIHDQPGTTTIPH